MRRNLVFISHKNPDDNDFALRLSDFLRENGVASFVDENDISMGDDIPNVIKSKIKNDTCLFLVVMSMASNNSNGVLKELREITEYNDCLREKIPIIPVRVDDHLNYEDFNEYVKGIKGIDCFDKNPENVFCKLPMKMFNLSKTDFAGYNRPLVLEILKIKERLLNLSQDQSVWEQQKMILGELRKFSEFSDLEIYDCVLNAIRDFVVTIKRNDFIVVKVDFLVGIIINFINWGVMDEMGINDYVRDMLSLLSDITYDSLVKTRSLKSAEISLWAFHYVYYHCRKKNSIKNEFYGIMGDLKIMVERPGFEIEIEMIQEAIDELEKIEAPLMMIYSQKIQDEINKVSRSK